MATPTRRTACRERVPEATPVAPLAHALAALWQRLGRSVAGGRSVASVRSGRRRDSAAAVGHPAVAPRPPGVRLRTQKGPPTVQRRPTRSLGAAIVMNHVAGPPAQPDPRAGAAQHGRRCTFDGLPEGRRRHGGLRSSPTGLAWPLGCCGGDPSLASSRGLRCACSPPVPALARPSPAPAGLGSPQRPPRTAHRALIRGRFRGNSVELVVHGCSGPAESPSRGDGAERPGSTGDVRRMHAAYRLLRWAA